MGIFDQFPYTNIHELNLTWILEMLGKIDTTMSEFVAINSLKYADPIQWNITRQYEKNTIVMDPLTGTAYISVQPVPIGVALTNTDYWTVVFDLEQFVTKANNNFTIRVEEQTTLTATFPTSLNNWLVWGGELYRANTNIIAGDQYVVDSNISRITIEEITGHPEELLTQIKTNLVAAINEVVTNMGDLEDLPTTDKSSIVNSIIEIVNTYNATIGDLNDLPTTDKSSIVASILELFTTFSNNIGDLATLPTTDKSSIVSSIIEMFTTFDTNIGDLAILNTTDKSSIVNAINEVITYIGDLNDLTTLDKTNLVNAINEVKSMILEIQLIADDVMRVYVDGVNGSDDNDGLTPATAVKTLDYAFTFAGSARISGTTSTGLNIYFESAGTYISHKSYFAGGELHLYNDAGGGVVRVVIRPDSGVVKFYTFYFHALGTVDDNIEINFDCTQLTLDNSGTWFNHAVVSTTNDTTFQQFSGGCRVVDSVVLCQFQIDGQLITNRAEFQQRLYVNTGNWLMYGDTTIKYLTARNSFITLNNHTLTISPVQSRPIYINNCFLTGLGSSPFAVEEPEAASITEFIAAYDSTILHYTAITTTISNKFNRLLFAQRCIISAKTLLNSYATIANAKGTFTECINYEDIQTLQTQYTNLDSRVTALENNP